MVKNISENICRTRGGTENDMNGTYCAHCNRFLFTNKQEHYCRVCKTLLSKLPMDYAEFTALSVNERYMLAYKLTKK